MIAQFAVITALLGVVAALTARPCWQAVHRKRASVVAPAAPPAASALGVDAPSRYALDAAASPAAVVAIPRESRAATWARRVAMLLLFALYGTVVNTTVSTLRCTAVSTTVRVYLELAVDGRALVAAGITAPMDVLRRCAAFPFQSDCQEAVTVLDLSVPYASLTYDPTFVCWEGRHTAAAALAIVLLCVYVVGFPVAALLWVRARVKLNVLAAGARATVKSARQVERAARAWWVHQPAGGRCRAALCWPRDRAAAMAAFAAGGSLTGRDGGGGITGSSGTASLLLIRPQPLPHADGGGAGGNSDSGSRVEEASGTPAAGTGLAIDGSATARGVVVASVLDVAPVPPLAEVSHTAAGSGASSRDAPRTTPTATAAAGDTANDDGGGGDGVHGAGASAHAAVNPLAPGESAAVNAAPSPSGRSPLPLPLPLTLPLHKMAPAPHAVAVANPSPRSAILAPDDCIDALVVEDATARLLTARRAAQAGDTSAATLAPVADPTLAHFTASHLRPSQLWFLQADLGVLLVLSVALIAWGEPASEGAAAGQTVLVCATLASLFAATLIVQPHKPSEGRLVVAVELYALALAMLQSVVNAVNVAVRVRYGLSGVSQGSAGGQNASSASELPQTALVVAFVALAYTALVATIGLFVLVAVGLVDTLRRDHTSASDTTSGPATSGGGGVHQAAAGAGAGDGVELGAGGSGGGGAGSVAIVLP
jgi:hypothetical protein